MRVLPRAIIVSLAILAAGIGLPSVLPPAHAQGGPTVRITAPSNGAALGNPVTVTVETSGAVIKDAAAGDPNAAHLHYFIDRDPATVLQPGQPIPSGQADIIHTPNTSEPLPSLSPGPHSVWVVLAHTDHTPYSPNVQDRVTFTIGGAPAPAAGAPAGATAVAAAQLPPGGTGGLLPSSALSGKSLLTGWMSPEAAIAIRVGLTLAIAGALVAGGLMLLRRQEGRGRSRV